MTIEYKDSKRIVGTNTTTGLKAYYKFEDDGINEQTTGLGLGSSADITVSGATFVAGKVASGKALSFDGTNDYATIGSSTSQFNFMHNTTHEFTIAFWLKSSSYNTNGMIFTTMKDTSSSYYGVAIRRNNSSTMGVYFGAGTSQNRLQDTKAGFSTDANWHHIVITAKASDSTNSLEYWQDGVSLGTTSNTGNVFSDTDASFAPYISQADAGQWLNGQLDNLSIWNRRLTDAEIATLYNDDDGIVITSANMDLGDPKPTNVQDNSILVEKNTGKRYWFDENKISTTGLKAYYNFDSTTGGLVNQATTGDGLGSSANGVNTSVTLDETNEKLGTGCYDFNGSSSKVVLGSASVWSFLSSATANTWSIVWWMKYDDTLENGHTIMSTTDGATQTDGMFIDNSGSGDIRLIQVDGNNGTWSSAIPDNTSWHHYAITWNAGTVTLYVDNISKGTQSQTAGSGTPQYGLNLGVNNDEYWTALTLDDMSIWSRVLTTDEISALYNSGSGAIMSEAKDATWTWENLISGFAGTWGKDPSDSQFEVSGGKINFLDNTSSTGDRTWLDLGTDVSTTKWLLRFKFNFSTLTSGTYYYEFDAGLSDTTVNNMTNQNFIGVRVLPSNLNNLWRPRTCDGSSTPRQGATANITQSFSTGTDYYCEIKRISTSNWSISLSTTNAYDGDIQNNSYTDAGSSTGLRYFKFGDAVTNSGSGFTMQGVCDILEFYNGVTSPP